MAGSTPLHVGLASGFLILQSTELGLVAHPITGYEPDVVRYILGMSEEMTVVNPIIVGKRAEEVNNDLTAWNQIVERKRPTCLTWEGSDSTVTTRRITVLDVPSGHR